MKSKIMILALAATVSLGACAAPQESHYAARDQKQNSYVIPGEELGRADVRKVQKSLAREGFYQGRIDGVWGRATSQAILDYQTERHPGQTDVTIDSLREFGIRMDQDYYDRSHSQSHEY